MNRLQLIESLRFRLDESVASVWSDMELSHYLDQAIKFVTRKQAAYDESYSNYEYNVTSSELRLILGGAYVFDTPYWLHRITTVRETETTNGGRNPVIPYRTLANRTGRFWTWDRTNRIRLVNVGQANITVECVKDPAPMLGGVVDDDTFSSPSGNAFFIKHSTAIPSGVRIEKEPNVFAGSMFEITGVDTNSHPVSGQRRRVTESSLEMSATNVAYTQVVFDTPFDVPLVVGDTYEMMPEVLPVFHEIVILHAAKLASVKKANLQQMEVLRALYDAELAAFIDAVTPRQTQEVNYIGMDRDDPYRYDQDIDHSRSI